VGFEYDTNAEAAFLAVGANPDSAQGAVSNSGPIASIKVLIDHLNAHGGLLGAKIVPVFYGRDSTAADQATQDQAACATFTQDNHVFAAALSMFHTDALMSCLEKAGAVSFDPANFLFSDEGTFATYPHYATAGGLSLTRIATAMVEALFAQGYFSKGAKIGLATYNTPPYTRAVNQALKPALARHGLHLTGIFAADPIYNAPGVAGNSSAVSSAVLRFNTQGITHVMFLESSSSLLFIWANQAESQRYRPRYGLNSNDQLAGNAVVAPAAQFHDALGVGWLRASDLTNPPANAAGKQCEQILKGKGQPGGPVAWTLCDQLFTLAAAINAGGQLTAAATIAGLATLRNPPSATLLSPPNFANGRRDGAAWGAHLAFVDACSCWHYTSRPHPLPG
jgi:hypothetical protein